MMSDPAPRRRSAPGVEERRRATQLVRPYLDKLEAWNGRAAMIGAAALSRTNAADAQTYRQRLADLIGEVETGYADFRSVIEGQSAHGRIDDVRNAFERLLSTLRASAGS